MSCIVYMVNYNYATPTTCPLALMPDKYTELQMSFATQKVSCNASCKTPFFHNVLFNVHLSYITTVHFPNCPLIYMPP